MRWLWVLVLSMILSVSAGESAAQFPFTPAYALVLTVDSSGQVTLESIQAVNLRGELAGTQPEVFADLSARAALDPSLMTAQLTDASGAVAFQTIVPALNFVRSETQPDPNNPAMLSADGAEIDGRTVELEVRTFSLRVPASSVNTRLFIQSGLTRSSTMIDLESALRTRTVSPQALRSPVTLNGYAGGDPANRLDLVIMGDGYTAAEEADFLADAQATVDTLFSIWPYNVYTHYFNVVAVFMPSNESGVDTLPYQNLCSSYPRFVSDGNGGWVPAANPTCCGDPQAQAIVDPGLKDTRYGGTFCLSNIHRLVYPMNETALYQDANAAYPDWDELVVLLNSEDYGGSGGTFATLTMHSAAGRILQHELGHSMMGLADEYTTSANYPACSDYGRAGITVSCRPNVTDQTSRSLLKWARWLLPSTPVPTVGALADPNTVGSWLGANYSTDTYYRSCHGCLMGNLEPNTPFGIVPGEQLGIALYRGGWEGDGTLFSTGEASNGDGIEMIEHGTALPNPQAVVEVAADGVANFSALVLAPAGAALAEAHWLVDGVLKSTQMLATGETASFSFTPALPREYLVTLQVRDRGTLLHATRQELSLTSQDWAVSAAGRSDGVELLSNTSFEDADPLNANLALGWKEFNLSKAKRICDTVRAASGTCSYLFKSVTGINGKLQQVVTGALGDADDSYLFRLQADAQNMKFKFTAVAKLYLTDATILTVKLPVIEGDAANLSGFLPVSQGATLAVGSPAVSKIKLMLKVSGQGGKLLVDDVSLVWLAE